MARRSKDAVALEKAIEDLGNSEERNENAREFHVHLTHIPVDWHEFANGRVGVDANGCITEVVLDYPSSAIVVRP